MSRWYGGSWYPPAPPKQPPPARGIKVKKMGATWWGQRWIEALERLSRNYSNRLARGRTYARAGRVHDLEVAPGTVTAKVTGSRARPYTVTMRITALTAPAWTQAIGEMAKQAVFAAELLSGQMPKEIEQAFRATGHSVFPEKESDLQTACSCPDWANPCKHIAATHYVLGEALDKDPFLLFELRGRGKNEVLEALRRLRGGAEAGRAAAETARGTAIPAVSLRAASAADYERLGGPLGGLRFRIEPPAIPGGSLRQLGTPASWSLEESVAEIFGPLYEAVSALAREVALRLPNG